MGDSIAHEARQTETKRAKKLLMVMTDELQGLLLGKSSIFHKANMEEKMGRVSARPESPVPIMPNVPTLR